MNKKDFIAWFNTSFRADFPLKDVIWRKTQSGFSVVLQFENGTEDWFGTYANKSTVVLRQVLKNFYDMVQRAAQGN